MAHRDWNEATDGRTAWRGYLATAIGFLATLIASFCGFVFAWRRVNAVMDHTSDQLKQLAGAAASSAAASPDLTTAPASAAGSAGSAGPAGSAFDTFGRLTVDERAALLPGIGALLRSANPAQRAVAVVLIGRMTPDERSTTGYGEEVVTSAMADGGVDVRQAAATAFAAFSVAERASHVAAFAALLDDRDPGVRHAAAATFGLLAPGERAGHVEKLAGVFEQQSSAVTAAHAASAGAMRVWGAAAADVADAVGSGVDAGVAAMALQISQRVPPDSALWMPAAIPAEQRTAAAAVGGAVVGFGVASVGLSAVLHALGRT